jgi:hypothetical protein
MFLALLFSILVSLGGAGHHARPLDTAGGPILTPPPGAAQPLDTAGGPIL